MGNTSESAKKAAVTTKARHGDDFYGKIGSIGGKKKVKKGFATFTKKRLQEVGAMGGSVSRRGK